MEGDSDDEPSNSSGVESTPKSFKSEASFVNPPEFDFSIFANLSKNKRKATAVFESPDDIKVTRTSSLSNVKCFEEPPTFNFPINSKSPNSRKCPFCRKNLPTDFRETPPTATRARLGYCQRHENHSTLREGKGKGYPEEFDFIKIRSRIKKLLPEIRESLDEESVVLKTLQSKTKHRNAATPMSLFHTLDYTQPGYYGARGASLITEIILENMGDEIRHKNGLMEGLRFCGGVTGYISSVIVPEVGIRLIMDDLKVDWENARKIMKESIAYGAVINAAVITDDDDDDDEDEDTC
jgi:RTC4-like domain